MEKKMLRVKKLQDLNKEDLEKQLKEIARELMRLNAQISTGTPPENPGRVRNIKRNIARIKTILKIKQEVKIE